jgi:hypothetical protein
VDPDRRRGVSDSAKILHEFKRNGEDTLRVSLSTFKGRMFVDIRLHYPDDNGELRPTKKGVTVPPELWDEIRAGVAAAELELQARGLWYPAGDAG